MERFTWKRLRMLKTKVNTPAIKAELAKKAIKAPSNEAFTTHQVAPTFQIKNDR